MAEGVNITIDSLQAKYNEIAEIDEKLAAASGSPAAGKRAITNQIVAENEANFTDFISQIESFLGGLDETKLVAAVSVLNKRLSDQFQPQVDAVLEAEVEARKNNQPTVSPDEIEGLREARKQANSEYATLRGILEMFGVDVTSVPEPKRASGPRGPRGPRAISQYQFYINDQARTTSQNTLSSIANQYMPESEESKTKSLKALLAANDIDVKNPPEFFKVTLPGGEVLKAERFAADEDDDDDEDVTDDDE